MAGAWAVVLAASLLFAATGCATSRAIDTATGHDGFGPPRGFQFVLEAAFADEEDGGIVLYGTNRSLLGRSAWFGTIRADAELAMRASEPGRTVAARLAVPREDWRRARDPYRLIVIPSAAGPEATPSEDDIDACTVLGQLRRVYREIPIVEPGQVAPAGVLSAGLLGDAVIPEGSALGAAPPQIVLWNAPRSVLHQLPEAGTYDVEVAFLEDTTEAAPAALLLLPLALALDAYVIGGVAAIAPPFFAVREGVDWVRGLSRGSCSYRYARGLEQGKKYGCRCVASEVVVEGGLPVAGCWGYPPSNPPTPSDSAAAP